jgi:hypothetical protein
MDLASGLCQTLGDELFFTCHIFLEVGKIQDLPSKIWQTVGSLRGQEGVNHMVGANWFNHTIKYNSYMHHVMHSTKHTLDSTICNMKCPKSCGSQPTVASSSSKPHWSVPICNSCDIFFNFDSPSQVVQLV